MHLHNFPCTCWYGKDLSKDYGKPLVRQYNIVLELYGTGTNTLIIWYQDGPGTVRHYTVQYGNVRYLYCTIRTFFLKYLRKIHVSTSTGASGRTNCREWSGYFSCGAGGDAGGGAGGDDGFAFDVGADDIRLSKGNIIRGLVEWCLLLPLNP